MPSSDRERALHEHAERKPEEERERAEAHRDDDLVARRPGPAQGLALRTKPTGRREPALEPGRDEDGGHDARQLDEREDGGRSQVEQADRLVVDLGFERRVPRPTEDQDDPERREREEEDDRGRGCERGSEERHRDLAEPRERRRTERRRGFGHSGIEARPERADDPNDDRDVEERVRHEDRRPSSFDPVRQDREERERDDDRRKNERDDDERAHEAAPAEPIPAEDVRGREGDRRS